jgi:hypothetical protein
MNKMNRKMAIIVILMIIVLVICVIKLILIGVNTQKSTIPNVTQSIHSTYRNYNINTAKPKASVKVKSSVKIIKKYRK